jgi:hypothetical protein
MLRKMSTLVLLFSWISPHRAHAQPADYSKASINELIDDLALIDSQAPGVNSAAIYGGFIGDDSPGQFQVGVLGLSPPGVPPQMRELVRRGISALPALIAHLDDARPTKLAVGNDEQTGDPKQQRIVGVNFFMFTYFSNEYDSRVRTTARPSMSDYLMRGFSGKYIVKVGDVCYALIGQIVNRQLLPVRYQPSAGLVVNSPIEAPALIEKVKKDWGDADAGALKASLLADVRATGDPYYYEPAFARLRFYYPSAYAALQGDDLMKRTEFETH